MHSLAERISALVQHDSTCLSPDLKCNCPNAKDAAAVIKEVNALSLQTDVSQNTIKMLAHALSIAIDDIAKHEGARPDAEGYVWRAAKELNMAPPGSKTT